jgi:long-subunit acyl-CoA synthetase (AMP-forming)
MNQILNPDTREPCGPGENGELCVQGVTAMLGYLNEHDKTEDFFIENGTRGCTGDLVHYTEEGDLIFIDRFKELIK